MIQREQGGRDYLKAWQKFDLTNSRKLCDSKETPEFTHEIGACLLNIRTSGCKDKPTLVGKMVAFPLVDLAPTQLKLGNPGDYPIILSYLINYWTSNPS
jgi:hypothetical protein